MVHPRTHKKLKSFLIHLFILLNNRLMIQGKKATAEKILLLFIHLSQKASKRFWFIRLIKALTHISPMLMIKTVKRGGRLNVPFPLKGKKQITTGVNWLIKEIKRDKSKKENISMRLTKKVIQSSFGKGSVVEKKKQIHQLGSKGKSLQTFRW